MEHMTLSLYMNNPSGKGSTVIPNRQLIIDDLKKRYNVINDKKKVKHKIYMIDTSYFYHVRIPSEDLEKDMFYDVVIEFYPIDTTPSFNIKNYGIRLFSNSPSFVYSYAYVYNKNNILATGSKSKFNDVTLSSPPVTRNPNEIVSFEKTIYFACIHLMSSAKYLSKIYIETVAKKLNIGKLYSEIKNSDEIEVEYQKQKIKKQELKNKVSLSNKTSLPNRKSVKRNKSTVGVIKPNRKKSARKTGNKITSTKRTYKK